MLGVLEPMLQVLAAATPHSPRRMISGDHVACLLLQQAAGAGAFRALHLPGNQDRVSFLPACLMTASTAAAAPFDSFANPVRPELLGPSFKPVLPHPLDLKRPLKAMKAPAAPPSPSSFGGSGSEGGSEGIKPGRSGSSASQSSDIGKRTKSSRACDECRRKKIRCDIDGDASICSPCQRMGLTCAFSRVQLKRGPSKRIRSYSDGPLPQFRSAQLPGIDSLLSWSSGSYQAHSQTFPQHAQSHLSTTLHHETHRNSLSGAQPIPVPTHGMGHGQFLKTHLPSPDGISASLQTLPSPQAAFPIISGAVSPSSPPQSAALSLTSPSPLNLRRPSLPVVRMPMSALVEAASYAEAQASASSQTQPPATATAPTPSSSLAQPVSPASSASMSVTPPAPMVPLKPTDSAMLTRGDSDLNDAALSNYYTHWHTVFPILPDSPAELRQLLKDTTGGRWLAAAINGSVQAVPLDPLVSVGRARMVQVMALLFVYLHTLEFTWLGAAVANAVSVLSENTDPLALRLYQVVAALDLLHSYIYHSPRLLHSSSGPPATPTLQKTFWALGFEGVELPETSRSLEPAHLALRWLQNPRSSANRSELQQLVPVLASTPLAGFVQAVLR